MLKKLFRLIMLIITVDEGDRNYCKFSKGYMNYKKSV